MHEEVRRFIKDIRKSYRSYFWFSNVVEIGSLDISGSARHWFWFCKYVGVDLGWGKSVDMVCRGHDYVPDSKVDVVISTETLEHDEAWQKTLQHMYDILKPGGLMIMTCASLNRETHGTTDNHPEASPFTNNYYKNLTKEDFRKVLNARMFETGVLKYANGGEDLQFFGIKKLNKED